MLRKERIERMLKELEYEITVGMMQGEIEEELGFTFIVPQSKNIRNGVVWCEFMARPRHQQNVYGIDHLEPRLRVVK